MNKCILVIYPYRFRAFDQNSKFIKSNWILILVTLGAMIITFAVIIHGMGAKRKRMPVTT